MNHSIFYIKKLIINIIITIIKIYQNTFSLLFPSTCRFNPSCSNYMILSIKKNGLLKGVIIGIKRISKCHPFSKSTGWDPA